RVLWFQRIFFFQAEDGIRDGHVTGVQTCALPISPELWKESRGTAKAFHGTLTTCVSTPCLLDMLRGASRLILLSWTKFWPTSKWIRSRRRTWSPSRKLSRRRGHQSFLIQACSRAVRGQPGPQASRLQRHREDCGRL